MADLRVGIDGTGAESGARVVTRSLTDIARAATGAINPVNALEDAAKLAAGAFAGFKFVDFIRECTHAAAQAESMSVVLRKVAENVGYSSDRIDEMTESVARMGMTQENARNTLTKMIQTNIDLSNATKLTSIAQNAAVIAHTNTAEALDMMNMSISTGMERTLKHMGIIVDFSKAEKDYAQALGKSIGLMTDKEKTQARVNDVIRASSAINGTYTASLSTANGIINQLKISSEETKDEIGKLFLPVYKDILNELLTALRGVQHWFEDNKGGVEEWSRNFQIVFIHAEATVMRFAQALDLVGQGWNAFKMGVLGVFSMFGDASVVSRDTTKGFEEAARSFDWYGARFDATGRQIKALSERLAELNKKHTETSNEAAAKAGAARTKLEEQAKAYKLLMDNMEKSLSAYLQSDSALRSLIGTQVDQAKATDNAYLSSQAYFKLVADANSGDIVAQWALKNNAVVSSLKMMKAAFDDLHVNDDRKNELAGLEVKDNPYLSQLTAIDQRYQKEREQISLTMAMKAKAAEMDSSIILDISAESEAASLNEKRRTLEIAQLRRDTIMNYATATATALGAIGQVMMQGNKKQFEQGKKLAEAEALINAAVAITKAFEQGGVYGYITSVGIAAATGVQINKIKSQEYTGMARGGYISGGVQGQDSVPIMAMPGEVVIKKDSVDAIGLDRLLFANRYGALPKFGFGGLVYDPTSTESVASIGGFMDPLGGVSEPSRFTNSGIDKLSGSDRRQDRNAGGAAEVAAAVKAVNEEFGKFGSTLKNLGNLSDDTAASLIAFSGGVDEFKSKTEDFMSNFYTSAEQAQIKVASGQKQMDETFKELNITVPKTRDEFKKIVEGLDLTTEAGQKEYAALMKIESGANDVYTASDNLAKKLVDTANAQAALSQDLTSRMMRLNGDSAGADLYELRIREQKELADAQEKGLNVTELLKVQSLEYADAVKKASSIISAAQQKMIDDSKKVLTDSVNGTMKVLDALKSILTGPQSMLSPEAAYSQAKTQFGNADIANLPSAAMALLEASKNYNASGPAYQSDLQLVLQTLGAVGGLDSPTLQAANDQIGVLGQILEAINVGNTDLLASLGGVVGNTGDNVTQTGNVATNISNYLASIKAPVVAPPTTNVITTQGIQGALHPISSGNRNTAVDQVLGRNTGISKFASGGLAYGWAMVGENGPELVNFTNPGRVYNANQTQAAMSGGNAETMAELREQNRLLRAIVQVLQKGFTDNNELSAEQAEHLSTIASKAKMEAAR